MRPIWLGAQIQFNMDNSYFLLFLHWLSLATKWLFLWISFVLNRIVIFNNVLLKPELYKCHIYIPALEWPKLYLHQVQIDWIAGRENALFHARMNDTIKSLETVSMDYKQLDRKAKQYGIQVAFSFILPHVGQHPRPSGEF